MYLIFVIATLFLSVDVFFVSSKAVVVNKTNTKILKQIIFLPISIIFGTALGMFLGKITMPFLIPLNYWYASTLLFMLSVKYIYTAFKLHKHKQNINVNNSKGLLILAFTLIINALLVGIAFGLLNINYKQLLAVFVISFATMLIGLLSGIKQKKQYNIRYDLISAIAFLIISILIISKH